MALSVNDISNIPLFIGLTQGELSDIATLTHFVQRHHKKGFCFIPEYSPCNTLVLVIRGRIAVDTYADNRSYHITEQLNCPLIIEPDKLFGLTTHYRSSYTALTPCDTLAITKEELMMILSKYMIARLNFLNIICRKSQHMDGMTWHNTPQEVKESIITFIRQHSTHPTGQKTLYIKMTQLAAELHFSRLEVSIALNALEDEEKIILRRGIIDIPEVQLL